MGILFFPDSPRLTLYAAPEDLIIENASLGYIFTCYPFLALLISLILANSNLLRVPLITVGMQSAFLFVAICGALIQITFMTGITILIGSLGVAGLVCFLVSRKEESQQFRIAQISTILSMVISAPTLPVANLACVLVMVIIHSVWHSRKTTTLPAMLPEQQSRYMSSVSMNLTFVVYWVMTFTVFYRLPVTAVTRAYKSPFSVYPKQDYSLLFNLGSVCLVACFNCMLNKHSNLDKVVPQVPLYSKDTNQGLTSYSFH